MGYDLGPPTQSARGVLLTHNKYRTSADLSVENYQIGCERNHLLRGKGGVRLRAQCVVLMKSRGIPDESRLCLAVTVDLLA